MFPLQLALYEPEIAGNVGAVMRLCACFGVRLHIVEPCGFVFDDKRLARAGMDYIAHLDWRRHASWQAFEAWRKEGAHRLLLFTTRGAVPYTEFTFQPGDILLFGREGSGAPEELHEAANARLVIPINPAVRSLNLGMSAAVALGEAARQVGIMGANHPGADRSTLR